MTVGIAFSIKSNLGISPVSTIPYTMTVIWGVEIGIATIIFHCILVLIQFILLKDKFGMKNLSQIPIGIIFGFFTSFSVYLLSFIPESTSFLISLIYMVISIFTIAFGIFLYLPPNLIPLAGEGAMQAVSIVFDKKFSNVKIGFDVTMVVISAITCLFFIHSSGSVGLGTIISAVFVGMALKLIVKLYTAFTGKTVDLKSM
ncbi:YczE/YyaS/YitT family protein [Methanobrevibacter sp.]|uniref:YczE/YyaS/YitT family protein n=1 Tax=Methanobrevibacter sp. TaxID=66852 RepID=UPI00388D3343